MDTIKIDNELVAVDELPDNIKALVHIHVHTCNEENDARRHLAMIEAAKSDITRRIVMEYRGLKAGDAKPPVESAGEPDDGSDPAE